MNSETIAEPGLKELRVKTKELVKELKPTLPEITCYSRPPLHKNVMMMSVENGRCLKIWAGTAKITAYPDKDNHQAVLNVSEEGRTISEIIQIAGWQSDRSATDLTSISVPGAKLSKHTLLNLDPSNWDHLQRAAGLIQAYRCTDHELQKAFEFDGWSPPRGLYHQHDKIVEILHTTEATETSFLVGIDESSYFVSELPQQVTSVEEAHEVLRPEIAHKEGTVRQGEWFFVPVEDDLLIPKLEKMLSPAIRRNRAWRILELNSTHHVPCLVSLEEKRYTTGPVVDTRRGGGRHHPLILPGWHEVVRNNEIVRPGVKQIRRYD